MWRVVWAQLRHHLGRSLALVVAVAVATGGFVLLTGSVETSRLQVRGTVQENFRSSYDLLIRPTSSYTGREAEQGLVRPNYQSGIFGGITTDQVGAVRAVPGVEVAAPVANLGYVTFGGPLRVSVQPYLNGQAQQLFRIRPTWTMDRGLSRFTGAPIYVYVSQNRAKVLPQAPGSVGDPNIRAFPTYAEVVPGRKTPVPACTNVELDRSAVQLAGRADTPFGYRNPYASAAQPMSCYYIGLNPAGASQDVQGAGNPDDLDTTIGVTFPVLLTAVDPAAEAALSGLDQAVVSGRALDQSETASRDAAGNPSVPVLAASSTDVDQQVSASIERVSPAKGRLLSDSMSRASGARARLDKLVGRQVDEVPPVPAAQSYRAALDYVAGASYPLAVPNYWTVGPSSYQELPGSLGVQTVDNPESVYESPQFPVDPPVGSDDSAVRPVAGHSLRRTSSDSNGAGIRVIGEYDPAKVAGDSSLSGVTSATYVTPLLAGADPANQQALGNQPLAPSTNLGGYPAQPPTLLTTLAAAGPLLDPAVYSGVDPTAPVSVVRVRVAGVTGADPVSRERLNQVALAIGQRTGLAVDIVAGASGVPTTVVLPAGEHGRPELRLVEDWARKGVAYTVVDAVDRKSLALFLLVLTVCALLVGNAASAAVRTRRTELGVLSCLGWPAGRLFAAVELELTVLGLLGGLIGAAAAAGAGAVFSLSTSWSQAGWAIPAAVALTAAAGLAPARRAAHAAPMDAVRPAVVPPTRNASARSIIGLARQSLRRVPGRTAVGAAALAVGVAAGVFLLGVQQLFRGVVVGSLLGDAVTVQVRTPDLVALAAIVVLGAAGVADVLYLTAKEQAAEFAILRATGWSDNHLARLVLSQGAGLGLLGGVAGALVGVAGFAAFAGALPVGILGIAALCAAAGVGVATGVAWLPAKLLRRRVITRVLAEEAG